MVSIDGRGTPGRGTAWEHAIYQKFGSVPLEDQVAGLKALGERFPAMDLARVGGNIESYAQVCDAARQQAFERMVQHAEDLGADAVIGMRYDATEFTQGATEVLAYGTAVQLG